MENRDNLKLRRVKVEVKNQIIEYDEYYLVDEKGEEIFDRNIEIENDKNLYNAYKKNNNLLLSEEIRDIRKKYNLNQKEYAAVLGVGEITIHRFEKGDIQTESVDAIMRLSDNPNNMYFLALQNKKNLSDELYTRLINRVNELILLKKHALIDINEIESNNLNFKGTSALTLAHHLINNYNSKVDEIVKKYQVKPEYITNLKLQKLLYYVQAFSLLLFNKKAFNEKIIAWSYGPVVDKVYQEYKENHDSEIKTVVTNTKLSDGLEMVVNAVIETYGEMEANKLIDFTHEEDPWKNTDINCEISTKAIKEYFDKVYK